MSLLNSASLVVTPNAYKEGTLYSVIPNSTLGDMTVVRATTATRVNSAGLIELVPYNLLTYSEQFNNAFWNQATSGSATFTVTANQTTAPNGTNTADLISITRSATSELSAIYTNVGQGLGTFKNSIYLKAKDNSNVGKTIDLWSWEGGTRGYTMITLTADWVRYEQDTTVFSVSGAELFDFGLLPISYSTSTTLAVEFYIWGAQAVQGSTAKDYLRTETRLNIPRLDYSNGTCPSLLVEPQRTNLFTYSEQFDNAVWNKSNTTISANSAISPSGINDADSLVPNTTNAAHFIENSNYLNLSIGQTYTTSFYAKANGYNFIQFTADGGDISGNPRVNFNLSNGTLGSVDAGITASIQDVGNGWYRCVATYVAAYNVFNNIICVINSSTAARAEAFIGNGTSGISIWGAQLEAGSYETSYIPTTSAAVTRNADVISKTGISSLIGQTEGTVFVEVDISNTGITRIPIVISSANPSTSTSEAYFYINGAGNLVFEFYTAGIAQCSISAGAIQVGVQKLAFVYKNNDFAFYRNGTQVGVDTSGTVASGLDRLYLGCFTNNGLQLNDRINSAVIFPTRLTNAELASLTTI